MICNTFIDACTSAICQEGGEVIKLIGDCVTAYFPGNAADAAVAAAQVPSPIPRQTISEERMAWPPLPAQRSA